MAIKPRAGVIFGEAAQALGEVLDDNLTASFYGVGDSFECSVCRTVSNGLCVNVECPIGYHNVWVREGSEDAMGDGHDPLELGRASSYAIGDVAAWEKIGLYLREKAGKAFAEGEDERAHWFRDIAEEMGEIGRQKRAAYNLEHKKLD